LPIIDDAPGRVSIMNLSDGLGYLASSAVLVTFLMTRMTPLRVIAIVSNVLFITFGFLEHIYPVLFLHLILLPINLWRLFSADSASAALLRPLHSRHLGLYFATGIFVGVLTMSAVMAFGVPEYEALTHSQSASLSLSRFNPVANATKVIKVAKARIIAAERKFLPVDPAQATREDQLAI
jgi:hypothetical protein